MFSPFPRPIPIKRPLSTPERLSAAEELYRQALVIVESEKHVLGSRGRRILISLAEA